MGGVVDAAKSLIKSGPLSGGGSLKNRATKFVKKHKNLITAAQKYDPGSKYLGISGVPGVSSQRKIRETEKQAEIAAQQAADAAAREANKPVQMPAIDTEQQVLARKREAARARRRGGRASTILSRGGETLG